MTDGRAYPAWWNHQRHSLVRLRRQIERELDSLEARQAGDLLVDLGCGDMPYKPIVEGRGFRYIGCDIEAGATVRIEPGVRVPLDDGCARVVGSFQVLEHVWDLDWYLGECRRLLRADGRLLLSTHGVWLYHPHPTDFRRWTADGLTREIERHGFAVERIEGLMGPLAWTTQFRLLGYREVLRRIPVVGNALVALACVLFNLRMEVEDAVTPREIRQQNASIYVVTARRA